VAENRTDRIAVAVQSVREWAPRESALQVAGIDPATLTADERDRFEEAEREAVDEAIAGIRRAARTDPAAARWLRERGIAVEG
jgi:hypothetical protein